LYKYYYISDKNVEHKKVMYNNSIYYIELLYYWVW